MDTLRDIDGHEAEGVGVQGFLLQLNRRVGCERLDSAAIDPHSGLDLLTIEEHAHVHSSIGLSLRWHCSPSEQANLQLFLK